MKAHFQGLVGSSAAGCILGLVLSAVGIPSIGKLVLSSSAILLLSSVIASLVIELVSDREVSD